jgi:pimeloyl-ACP methyl ester carboxylesterase
MAEFSEWRGFKLEKYEYRGREVIVQYPRSPAPGNPWVWRPCFFGSFDNAETALAGLGWHIAQYQVNDLYGAPPAVKLMKDFHRHITGRLGLSPKAALFGFSRGGLYGVNYALAHPGDLAALYLDAPVLDITSWPGGFGAAARSGREWEECKAIYGLSDEAAASFRGSPIHKAAALAETGIPLLIVAGDADEAVPIGENAYPFVAAYEKSGGKCRLIVKPGVGHHPHGLEDPAPVLDFVQKARAAV